MTAPYLVVLYGATGVTGRQAAAYLDSHLGKEHPWAIAGRSADSLHRVRSSLHTAPDVIVAEASDASAIDSMVSRTNVILTTAGPYATHGEPLICSCATRGVDYVDISGETPWVRRMIDRYGPAAESSGAKIVSFCGFDSVPSDLGTHVLVEHHRSIGKGTTEVRAFHRARGTVSGGTIASIAKALDSGDIQAVDDPFLLNPTSEMTQQDRFRNRDPQLPKYDPDLGRWVAPSLMARINTRVVRRSAALSSAWHRPYGDTFRYREYWDLAAPLNFFASSTAAVGVGVMQMMSMMPGAGRILSTFASTQTDLPGRDQSQSAYFECNFLGTADDGASTWSTVSGTDDPSTTATAKFLCESGLALTFDRNRLPGGDSRTGMLTPATAFGSVLVERLRRAGVRIDCPVND